MENKEIIDRMNSYPVGTVVNLTWDRGNGKLSKPYVFLGSENNVPIFKGYEEGRDLASYSGLVTFDIFNPEFSIKSIGANDSKSVESLEAAVQ
jgi:hypothetical protein